MVETRPPRTKPTCDLRPIEPLLALVCDRYTPLQVWLFGSRARDDAHEASDWDLAVVVQDDAPEETFNPRLASRLLRDGGWPADIFVTSKSDFDEDLSTVNTIPFAVATEGILLCER